MAIGEWLNDALAEDFHTRLRTLETDPIAADLINVMAVREIYADH